MKVGIMQPYFLPYLGYFQLVNTVDKFVVYDNVQYTKKGWINRNRYCSNGKDELFSLPLKKDSNYLDIYERELSEIYEKESLKIYNRFRNAYKNAPYADNGLCILEKCLFYSNSNLFEFVYNSLLIINEYLGIDTEIIISSRVGTPRELKSQDKVINICEKLSANDYINLFGGVDLYNKEDFLDRNINLSFIKMNDIQYIQGDGNEFITNLSIIDVIMWNDPERIKKLLHWYTLI